jgi:uncharacterized caspase-like protein
MLLINDYDSYNIPTEQIIVQTLQSMTMNASPDDFLMFYFSGHGIDAYDDILL